MNDIPKSWAWARLDQVCAYIQRGKSPSYTALSELPVVNQKCVRWWGLDLRHLKFVDPKQWPDWGTERFLQSGDILWNSTGTGTIGRACIYSPDGLHKRMVVDSHITILRVAQGLKHGYLHYFVMSPSVQKRIFEMQAGSTNQVELPKSEICETVIPLPPEKEQERIVAKIDELFSRIEEGERALAQVRKSVERCRQSVLKAAVTGELTRDWREKRKGTLRSGKALLHCILKARRQAWERAELDKMKAKGLKATSDDWKARYEDPPQPDISDLPDLPTGWVWVNLGQIKLFSLYGPRFSSSNYAEAGYVVLRTTDIGKSGRVNASSAPKLKLSVDEFQKYRVEKGDLLITRTGSLGTLALFDDDIPAIPGAYLIQFRIPAPSVTRWYIFYFLRSPIGQQQLLKGGAGVGRPNLNAPTIEAIPIPLPPLEEQRIIVDAIETTLESTEKQFAQLQRSAMLSGALRQAVLKLAFDGRLVTQEQTDESATILLERITEARDTKKMARARGGKAKARV